jgi:hypothetical protein
MRGDDRPTKRARLDERSDEEKEDDRIIKDIVDQQVDLQVPGEAPVASLADAYSTRFTVDLTHAPHGTDGLPTTSFSAPIGQGSDPMHYQASTRGPRAGDGRRQSHDDEDWHHHHRRVEDTSSRDRHTGRSRGNSSSSRPYKGPGPTSYRDARSPDRYVARDQRHERQQYGRSDAKAIAESFNDLIHPTGVILQVMPDFEMEKSVRVVWKAFHHGMPSLTRADEMKTQILHLAPVLPTDIFGERQSITGQFVNVSLDADRHHQRRGTLELVPIGEPSRALLAKIIAYRRNKRQERFAGSQSQRADRR